MHTGPDPCGSGPVELQPQSSAQRALICVARRDLRFAALFLCRTPFETALSSLRAATAYACCASSFLPAAMFSRTTRMRSEERRVGRDRSWGERDADEKN